jgi:diphthamide biosynthesis protein 4
MNPQQSPTHYAILDLPTTLQNESSISAQMLRTAYRRALLRNHPDKSSSKPTVNPVPGPNGPFTIDQITHAFRTLSDPQTRNAYNSFLALNHHTPTNIVIGVQSKGEWKTGVETVDLDDLNTDADVTKEQTWYKSCRCGEERGFVITEGDLEDAAREGEVMVGCRGCSLWLRVLFGVVEDDGS